jgi:hypothetical protein
MRVPFIILLVVMTFAACEQPVMPLPGTTGKAGEVVVVMDDMYSDGPGADSLKAALTESVYGLPQPESHFDVVQIRTEAFTKIFRSHRNVVIATIQQGLNANVEVRADVWSTPQIVIEITAPDEAAFIDIFSKNKQRILAQLSKKEEERNRDSYSQQPQREAIAALESDFQVRMPIPKGFSIISRKENFIWLRYDTKDINQSIIVYTEPYQRQNTFTKIGMVEMIDRTCREHVPGSVQGSFMKTFTEYPPRFNETMIAGRYATELLGLWHVEGDIMGGPFVCYSFLDEERQRVVHLHGFVFAPGVNKRNLMVQLRSIIKGAEVI